MADPDFDQLQRRMDGALDALKTEFAGLRTGRASASLLEPIQVQAYGGTMALKEVGTVSVPEPRLITVQVWDKSLVSAVDKAIREGGLGLNPAVAGQLIRVPIPALSEERRRELTKVASKYTEQARVAVRNVRRDGMEMLKKLKADGDISEDDHAVYHDEVQEMTDKHIKKIDEMLAQKEAEILQV